MIPISDRIRPRPLWARWIRRLECEEWGVPLPDPTEAEISDAIAVLKEGPLWADGLPDPVLFEATRVLDDSR